MLLRCAVHLTDNAKDIAAEHFARAYPVPRLRANAIAALAAVADDREAILSAVWPIPTRVSAKIAFAGSRDSQAC